MRVLVTGGCGFVGSHVVDALVDAGVRVRVLDRRAGVAAWRNDEAEYVAGDVRSVEDWSSALRGVDAVCHQAARVGLGVDFSDVAGYVDDNDVGTAAGLLAMHRLGFRGRVVLASSMVVYGEGAFDCVTHGRVRPAPRRSADLAASRFEPRCPDCDGVVAPALLDEDDRLDPRNVYAATKLHQEHLCAAWGREQGVAVAALRYHNVYGPRLPVGTPYAGVAALFRSELAAGRPPLVFEDGGQRRDFVHVSDVARANVLALTAAEPPDGPLNIASGVVTTVAELAVALAHAVGGPMPVVTGQYRLGDVRHITASPARAAKALGFVAEVALADGLRTL